MKISDLEMSLVEVPCVGDIDPVRSLIVRLVTDSGLEGWGECEAVYRYDELVSRREYLLPSIAGHQVFNVEDWLENRAFESLQIRSAFEMALWDIIGKATQQPVCHLLGGAYRDHIPLAIRIPKVESETRLHLLQEWTQHGIHAFFLTLSVEGEDSLKLLQQTRDVIGDHILLRADVENQWDLDQARDFCLSLEDQKREIEFLVDPIANQTVDELVRLRKQVRVPIAAANGIRSAKDVMKLVRKDAVDVVVVDFENVGGLFTAKKCAMVADAAEVSAIMQTKNRLGIATAAMLQLNASTPNFSRSHSTNYPLLQDDILQDSFEVLDGMLSVPQAAGLGIEVDRDKLEKYALKI